MGVLQEVKQVWTQGDGQLCFTHACSQPCTAVAGQVVEVDAALHYVQVGDTPGHAVAGIRRCQIHYQERTPVYQREARLPPLEDLIGLTQDRQRHRDPKVVGHGLFASRRERLADVAHRARDAQDQVQTQPDVAHAALQHRQDGNRPIYERLVHHQRGDLRRPTGIAGEQGLGCGFQRPVSYLVQ